MYKRESYTRLEISYGKRVTLSSALFWEFKDSAGPLVGPCLGLVQFNSAH